MNYLTNNSYHQEYSNLLQQFIFLLRNDIENIVLKKDAENSLEKYDFSYIANKFTNQLAQKQSPPSRPHTNSSIAKNKELESSCTLCHTRVSYKTNQFTKKKIRFPFLILLYNPIYFKKEQYFQSSQKDILFQKIIYNTFNVHPNVFLIRDIIRCHFNNNSFENTKYSFQNCISHIKQDIQEYSIQGILCFGNSVSNIIFPKHTIIEKAGKVFDFLGVPTVVSPGIDNLVHSNTNNSSKEKLLAEKKKLFFTLKLFHKEVLQW